MIKKLGPGQVAIVTGAAQGIGWATTRAFAEAGMTVYACDLQGHKVHTRKEELGSAGRNIFPVTLDVTSSDDIAALAEMVKGDKGYLRVLFNCAGWVPGGPMREAEMAVLDKAYALNVRAPFEMSKVFGNLMVQQEPQGRNDRAIINVGSVASGLLGAVSRSIYGVTKGAVSGLTMATAVEYGGSRIRCVEVQPGAVNSESFQERASDPEARAALIARQPLGVIAHPEDIAHMIVALAENPYMHATSVIIDGGWDGHAGARSPAPPEA